MCIRLLTNISALMEVVISKNQDADNYCNYQKVRSSNKKKKKNQRMQLAIYKIWSIPLYEKKKRKRVRYPPQKYEVEIDTTFYMLGEIQVKILSKFSQTQDLLQKEKTKSKTTFSPL